MSPTLADVIAQVEALTADVSALRSRLAEAESRLAEAEPRLPPPGWESGGYTLVADPKVSLARNSDTGRWVIWRIPALQESDGATPSEAIRAWGGQ